MNARRVATSFPMLLLLAALVVAFGPSIARANDWYVDYHGSCYTGDGSASNPFCKIGPAIAAASAGDTIHVARGYYYEAFVVDRDLTILGAGADINTVYNKTAGATTMVVAAGVTLSISGLKLTGGEAGGVVIETGATVTMDGCSIDGNSGYAYAGGIVNNGSLSLMNCEVANNQTDQGYGGDGGGIANYGTLQVTSSRITGNTSYGSGGGICNEGNATLSHTWVEGNLAWGDWYRGNPDGGGLCNWTKGTMGVTDCMILGNMVEGNYADGGGVGNLGDLTLTRSTVSQNESDTSDRVKSGGIYNFDVYGTTRLDHTIVAGNFGDTGNSPSDCAGTITSLGHDLIGDTAGCTIVGDETGNLYDVDPLLGSDGSLQPGSPCIDAGDPAFVSKDVDLAGQPRVLDGDLDRRMVVDMGALEFAHAQLAVTGDATPGGKLTVSLDGTAGLSGLLLVGSQWGYETLLPPYGTLFFGLKQPWLVLPIGTLPATQTGNIPDDAPSGLRFVLQALGLDPSSGAGNLSNASVVTVE